MLLVRSSRLGDTCKRDGQTGDEVYGPPQDGADRGSSDEDQRDGLSASDILEGSLQSLSPPRLRPDFVWYLAIGAGALCDCVISNQEEGGSHRAYA